MNGEHEMRLVVNGSAVCCVWGLFDQIWRGDKTRGEIETFPHDALNALDGKRERYT